MTDAPWKPVDYDARIIINMGHQSFEIILGQVRGHVPTRAEMSAIADEICNSVNLVRGSSPSDGRRSNGGNQTHEDLRGKKFGRLRVKFFVRKNRHRRAVWRCVCDCGGVKDAEAQKLKLGKVISCGCITKAGKPRKNAKRRKITPEAEALWNSVCPPRQSDASPMGMLPCADLPEDDEQITKASA